MFHSVKVGCKFIVFGNYNNFHFIACFWDLLKSKIERIWE